MALNLQRQAVSYESRLAPRTAQSIDTVVIHCTELPNLEQARIYAERVLYAESQTGACGHYYVGKQGELLEFVDPERVAHHCVGYNARSVGIELDNLGRYPDWLYAQHQSLRDPYPEAQIAALLRLLETLIGRFGELRWMAGHSELDTTQVAATDDPTVQVARKVDPGPLFPWSRLETAFAGRLRHCIPPALPYVPRSG